MLNVPVNNFSHVGMEPPLPGYYQYFWGLKICLAQGHNTATQVGLKPRTSGSGVRGVNHQATAPPRCQVRVSTSYHKSVVEVDISPALGEVNTACNVGQMNSVMVHALVCQGLKLCKV